MEYLPGLQKYEDIYFNSAIQRQGGQMLKCQCYCYRALSSTGKTTKNRKRKLRETPSDLVPGLMDTPHFHALGLQERHAVKQLSDWAKQRENHNVAKNVAKRERLEALKRANRSVIDAANEDRKSVV